MLNLDDAANVSEWVPARKFPESYPGDCPEGHYLLLDGKVIPVIDSSQAGQYHVLADNEAIPVDSLLKDLGLPTIAERFPVLSYGANRNPATIQVKLENYSYNGHRHQCALVLRATLSNADIVACRLHGQGYLYGELLVGSAFSKGVELDVRVALVDRDGLRVLNDSEGLKAGQYSAARVPDVSIAGIASRVRPIGYIANARVWSSTRSGGPVSFSTVNAVGRKLQAFTARGIMNEALDALNLRRTVAAATGIADDPMLAQDLAKFLNGQWWYKFHTGDKPVTGYQTTLDLFDQAISRSTLDVRSLDHLNSLGLVLPTEQAYDPNPKLTFGHMIAT